jgi:pimeloyl-ACP methyl ester carboxylesterase
MNTARLLLTAALFSTLTASAAPESGPAAFIKRLQAGEKITIVTMGTSPTGGQWRWPDVMMAGWLNRDYTGQVTLFNEGVGASASSAEVDLELLHNGWAVAYIECLDLIGCDAALDLMDQFYSHMTEQRGFARKAALEAVSRGGLHAYRYAARHPDSRQDHRRQGTVPDRSEEENPNASRSLCRRH